MSFSKMCLSIVMLLAAAGLAIAQEPVHVNGIAARVNNDIITRGDYVTAVRDFREELARQMQQQGKSQPEIDAEFEKLRPTVMDILVEDLLLEQRAKEMGIEVEAEVNQQMIEIAKENGFKNLIDFEEALKKQGVDPEAARSNLRKKLLQQLVIQREVWQPIFQSITDKERRDFYEKNKEGFTIPGEVVLSEIFLPLEGHTGTEVEQRARRLVAELRAGANFVEAVKANSAATRASQAQNGKLGSFKLADLKPDLAAAIKDLKPGETSEPIRLQDGYQIVRLDDRKPAVLRKYEEPDVQRVINNNVVAMRAEDARKKYVDRLREEAYVDIHDGYPSAKSLERTSTKQAKGKAQAEAK